tara:strand:+ start:1402 stop:1674 length:273 start_codon:yes stop_codon:yes gene_type:complete
MENSINNTKEVSEARAAKDFESTTRGQYLMGQAIARAVTIMEKDPIVRKEVSNIADLKYIGENAYSVFYELELMKLANYKAEDLTENDKK